MIRNTLLVFIIALFAQVGLAASGISLQGRILKGDGTPVTGHSVQFRIQIRSPGTEDCLLFQESQTLDMSSSNGMFALTLGQGARSASTVDGGYSLERVFSNTGVLDLSGTYPAACSLGTNYIPSPADNRKIVYQFNDGTGWQTVPSMTVNWVPLALNAMQVGGYKSDHLLRVMDASGNPAAAPSLTSAQATELMNLITGTSTQYISPNGGTFNTLPQYAGSPTNPNDLVTKSYVDSSMGAALPNVGTAGTYYKVTTDAKGRVISGAASLVEADIPQLTTAGKVDGGAINAGTLGGSAAINTSGNLITSGTVSANVSSANQLRIYNGAGNYVQFTAPTVSGALLFKLPGVDGAAGQVLKTDGSGNLSWVTPSAGSVTSVGANAPLSSSGGSTPSISITQANSTTDGYLSSTDWNAFNSKLGTSTALSGDVSGTYSATSVDKIKGTSVSTSGLSSGQFLKFNGSAWVNTALTASDIPGLDASTITAGTLPVNRGGTGTGSFSADQMVIANGTGSALMSFSCSSGQVLSFSALGAAQCENVNAANLLVRLDGSGKIADSMLPSSALTTATSFSGDVSGTYNATSVNKIKGVAVSGTPSLTTHVLQYNGSAWVPTVLNDTTKLPLAGGTMTGNLDLSPNTNVLMGTYATDPSGLAAADQGRVWYNTTSNQLKYWDGSAVKTLGVAGSGMQSLNGSSVTAQSFATPGTSGTAPAWSTNTGTGVHTLNVPMASTSGVTAGLISKTDYDVFNNKLGTSTSFSGDVSGAYNATSVDKIQGTPLSTSSLSSGNILKYNGSAWVNSALSSSDVTGALGYTPVNRAGDTMSGALNMNGSNVSNVGSLSLKGSTSGTLSMTVPATVTSYTLTWPAADGSSGQFLKTDGSGNLSWASASSVAITSLNGLTASTQTFAIGTSGNSPSFSSATATHTLNIPMASTASVTAGLLSKTDYDTFNNKLGTTTSFSGDVSGAYDSTSVDKIKGAPLSMASLSSGNFLKYNGSAWVNSSLGSSDITGALGYTPVNRAGDTMSGALNLGGNDLKNTGNIEMASSKNFLISNNASDPAGLTAADKGRFWFNSSTNQLKYYDGSSIQALGVAGAGITNFNGSTVSSQSFATPGTSGTAPAWSTNTGTGVHTLNVPMASASGVTAGLLSKTDYDTFNTKLGTSTSFTGDVSGAYNATSVDKIKAAPVSVSSLSSGNFLKYNGSAWVNSNIAAGDITSGTLTVAQGGTGASSFSGDSLVGTNTTGTALQSVTCAQNQVLSFDASGKYGCYNLSAIAGGTYFANGGNSFGGATSLGTNDSNALNFKTNNTTWMTIDTAGNVGVGTASPVRKLSISGDGIKINNTAGNAVLEMQSNGGNLFRWMAANTNYQLYDATNSSARLVIKNTGEVGIGTSSPGAALDVKGAIRLSGATSGYTGFQPAANAGSTVWTLPVVDGSTGQFLVTDGSGNLSWASASSVAITSLNGSSVNAQSFATPGTSGTAPAWSTNTGTGVHTLNIPMASTASVTAGLISKTDYDTFNSKLGTSTAFSGDVSGAYNATSVDKIKGAPLSISSLSSGNFLKYNGSAWVNTSLASADITGALGYTPVNKAGDTMSGSLDLAGKNVTNVGTLALKGSTSGTLSMTVPATVTSYTLNWPSAVGSANQVLSTDASGNLSWATVASASNTFVNNGNSFGVATTLGTNDNQALNFETYGTTRMTIDTAGKIGIGTASPTNLLHLNVNQNSATSILIENTTNAAASAAVLTVKSDASNGSVQMSSSSSMLTNFQNRMQVTTGSSGLDLVALNAAGDVRLYTGGLSSAEERMRVTSAGKVGIGTTNPGAPLDVKGEIRMSGTTSGYAGFKSPAAGPSVTWTLPTADGSAGQFLKTDGSGNLSWATSATPGDATYAAKGIVQFNTDAATSGVSLSSGIATVNTGTGANQIVKLDASSKLPAVDGSALTNLNANNITSGTLPISRGGTGTGSLAGDNLVGTNTTGTALQAVTCAQNQVLSFDAAGKYGCYNLSAIAGGTYFANGGNSFAGSATLGTNDNNTLSFKTNNSTRMTIDTAGKVGVGTSSPSTIFDVSGTIKVANGGEACAAGADGGMIRYNGGNLQFCNGSSWQTLGVSGAGLTNLNGLTTSTQSFVTATTGTDFTISSAGSAHTFAIPSASSSARGLLTSADWSTFNNKLGTSTSFSGDVSGAYNATSVDKIKAAPVSISSLSSGNYLKYNGSAWVNASLGSSDITGALGYTPVNKAGDTMSGSLDLAGKNITNVGTLALKGSTSGTLSMTVPATVTSYTLNWPAAVGSANQVLSTDASGNLSWATVASATNTFVNGGNSFGGTATLGTNDGNALNVETYGTTRMTIDTSGNVGIGTTSPSYALEVANATSLATTLNAKAYATEFTFNLGAGGNDSRLQVLANRNTAAQSGHDYGDFRIQRMIDSTPMGYIAFNGGAGTIGNRGVQLGFNDTPAMTVIANGKVGIGTTSPAYNIDVVGAGLVANTHYDLARFGELSTGKGMSIGYIANSGGTGISGSYLATTNGDTYIGTNSDHTALTVQATTGNVGIGMTNPGAPLDVKGEVRMSGATSGYAGFKSPAVGPSVTWTLPAADGSAGQFLKTDGSGNLSWASASSAAITSLNGLTASTQTFAIGTSGNSPNFSSATATHTLNIPMASTASVTAGLISKTDYDTFNSKLGTSTAFSGDVSGAYNATSVDKIKAAPVSISSLSSGNFLKYNGSAWVNTSLASADITGALGYTPVNRAGDTMSGALNMNGQNITNLGSESFKGTTSGTLSITVPATVTSYTMKWPSAVAASNGQVLSSDTSGNLSWTTVASASNTFVNGGNSFAGTATLGTNDNNLLAFETNNTTRMTIGATGKVGIGGSFTPAYILDVIGNGSTANTNYDVLRLSEPASGQGLVFGYTENAGATGVKTSYVTTIGSDLQLGTASYNNAISILNSNSNVGIANSNPSYRLDVAGSGLTANTTYQLGRFAEGSTGSGIFLGYTVNSGGTAPVSANVSTSSSGVNLSLGPSSYKNAIYVLDSNGNVGIGTTSPAMTFDTRTTSTSTASATMYNAGSLLTANPASASSSKFQSQTVQMDFASGATSSPSAQIYGVSVTSNNNSAGTIGISDAIWASSVNNSTGTISTAHGLSATVNNSSTGVISNGYGVYTAVSNSSGTVTNGYGIYIDTISSGNKWSVYANDSTAPSYFAGKIGIGTNSPNTALDINGAESMRGMAAPAVSVAGQGRIYFDSTANKYKVSENGGAYVNLVGGGGTGTVTSITAGTGLTGGTITTTGTLAVDVGTGANQIVQLNASSKLPAVDGSQLTNLSAAQITAGTLPVTRGGTGLVSGTSGGIPYFSSATTMASSGALTANGVVLGGGAGASPTATTAGSADQVLRVPAGGGAPAFGAIDLSKSAAVTGTLAIGNGGTGLSAIGANGTILTSNGTSAAWSTPTSLGYWMNGGNSFGANAALGTNDNFTLGFETNNSTRMTIDTSGNVGIGTTSPGYPLVVSRASSSSVVQVNSGTNDATVWTNGLRGVLALQSSAGAVDAKIKTIISDSGSLKFGKANDAWGVETTHMTIDNSGNVGIGTTTPDSPLHIRSAFPWIHFDRQGGYDWLVGVDNGSYASNSDLIFRDSSAGTVRMIIKNTTGAIGIGTTTPSATNKLEVAGSVRATSGTITGNYSSVATTTIDFSTANVITTSASCGAMTLSGMQDGGSYTLIVTGSTSGTCTFTHTGVTGWKFSPANAATDTTSSGHTVYTFLKAGANVYISWITGMR